MAGTARRFADLVGEHLRQAREVRPCELQVDPVVSGHPVPEVFDDRLNGVESTESLVQSVCHGLTSVRTRFVELGAFKRHPLASTIRLTGEPVNTYRWRAASRGQRNTSGKAGKV